MTSFERRMSNDEGEWPRTSYLKLRTDLYWRDSNGELTRTEGGYLLSGKKYFASQSPAGDLAVTSARYQHPEQGWQVLHFPVSLKSRGVSILDDWDTMGIRGWLSDPCLR